jgi:hypothetical protein
MPVGGRYTSLRGVARGGEGRLGSSVQGSTFPPLDSLPMPGTPAGPPPIAILALPELNTHKITATTSAASGTGHFSATASFAMGCRHEAMSSTSTQRHPV